MLATPTSAAESDAATRCSILVVEDEQDLLELLRYNLEREGYDVRVATTGEDALTRAAEATPQLILLDLMLPAMDGLAACRALRRRPATAAVPIIMVTAKGEEGDIVRGLEIGADDYITKPFSPRVLLARMQAVLRRAETERDTPAANDHIIEAHDIRLDPQRHEVLAAGQAVELTATEFKLLALLARRPGRVYTRQQIIESIHDGAAAVTDRSVDVQVVALRRKLGAPGANIETVRGIGYRFKD
ncbi:MAG: response regulator [Phycisphaeraceae bacterium]